MSSAVTSENRILAPDGGSLFSARYRGSSLGIVVLVSLIAFEAMAVSTSMPVAAQALGGVRQYGLAFSLFLTMSMLGTVVAGGWADRRGPRQPMLTGLACFAGGLLVAGTASSYPALLLGRAISGLGGGLQVVCLYVLVAAAYPAGLQPRVFGMISGAWVLPSLLGPPVAGLLTTLISWRAVFLLVPPLAVAPLLTLWPGLSRTRLKGGGSVPVDRPGPRVLRGIGLAAGVGVLQFGLQGSAGRAGVLPAILLCGAGLLLAGLAAPGLVPAGTFRLRRGLPSLVVTRGLLTGAFSGSDTFLPLMLVTHRGLSPTAAGLVLTAGALGWSAASWFQGRRQVRTDRVRLLALGCLIVAAAVLALAVTPLAVTPPWAAGAIWAVGGFGMGLGMASTSVLTLRLSPPGEEGRGSAGLQIGDNVGVVLGIGVAGAVLAGWGEPGGTGAGFSAIWIMMSGVGVLAALAALRVAPPAQRVSHPVRGTPAGPPGESDRGTG